MGMIFKFKFDFTSYKKELKKKSNDELYIEWDYLKDLINICESYKKTCPNTFIGILGAEHKIQKYKSKISCIMDEFYYRSKQSH